MNEFFARLKQRKLVQWALAYVAFAFALIQVLDVIAQRFGWPDQIEKLLILALAIGFLVALVLAWYHGDRGAQRVSGTELLILALLLAIGGGLLWRFARVSPPVVVARMARSYNAADCRSGPCPRAAAEMQARSPALPAPTPAASVAAIPAKSIAVLPFENLSDDKSNAYFASGMQDEILTRLAGIHDLKVISRTSTEQYASHPPNLKVVAEQLGVATVLEGSVQKVEGKVRIDVQLIDARNDSHLWAQNYDRDLKDVFAVQSDVAGKVADALKAQLLPAESARIASVPTQNQQAYDLFLKAEYFTNQIFATGAKNPAQALRKAADLYERAIAADPDFALAYAQLSYLKAGAYWQGTDPSPQAIAAAQSAATKALALQPNLPEAHLAMGYVHYWGHRDYAAALREFAIARASLPNDANVIAAIAYVHRRQGKFMQCIAELQQAAIIAPRNPLLPMSIGTSYVALRRYADADAAFQRALVILPDSVVALVSRAAALMMGGDTPAAARVLATIPAADGPQGTASLARFDLAMAMRQPDAALAAIAKAPAWLLGNSSHELIPVTLLRGQALARKGDSTAARAAFLDAQQMLAGRSGGSQDQADTQSDLADVYAGLGHKEAALKAARRAAELLPMSQDMLAGPFYLARLAKIEAQVGETDSALDHVRQLLAAPAGAEVSAASLRTDPVWDPLRKDPRFQKLITDAKAAQAKIAP